MVALAHPDVYEAFDAEFAERLALSADVAAEAAAEGQTDYRTLTAELEDLLARMQFFTSACAAAVAELQAAPPYVALTATEPQGPAPAPLGPDFALTAAELDEALYWEAQAARESYGDFIARQAAELETDEEPAGYHEPTDEQLCRVR